MQNEFNNKNNNYYCKKYSINVKNVLLLFSAQHLLSFFSNFFVFLPYQFLKIAIRFYERK